MFTQHCRVGIFKLNPLPPSHHPLLSKHRRMCWDWSAGIRCNITTSLFTLLILVLLSVFKIMFILVVPDVVKQEDLLSTMRCEKYQISWKYLLLVGIIIVWIIFQRYYYYQPLSQLGRFLLTWWYNFSWDNMIWSLPVHCIIQENKK